MRFTHAQRKTKEQVPWAMAQQNWDRRAVPDILKRFTFSVSLHQEKCPIKEDTCETC